MYKVYRPIEEWSFDPFTPTEHEDFLYGRGSADMKSSLAAMIIATENYLATNKPNFRIGFLITSDEEGHAIVLSTLSEQDVSVAVDSMGRVCMPSTH